MARPMRLVKVAATPPMQPANRLVTPDELQRHYAISETTRQRWMQAGMPYTRMPLTGWPRFVAGEVAAWVASAAEEHTASFQA